MTVITNYNRKGGVGKSTSTINLSCALAEKGYKVLAIDLDDQQNTSRSVSLSSMVTGATTIEDLLLKEDVSLNDIVLKTEWENVWILPASSNLSGVTKYLDDEVGGHNILREKLRDNDFFDYIIIDTSPSLSMLVINGLCASDYMLIPLSSKYLSLEGVRKTLGSFKKVTSRLNPDLKLLGIAFVYHDGRTSLANEVIGLVKDTFKKEMFTTIIGTNTKIEKAQAKKQSILTYSANDRGSSQYRMLAEEILTRIQSQSWG